jgi:hypothetical protein
MYYTDCNVFFEKGRGRDSIIPGKTYPRDANAQKPQHQIKPDIIYNHQMNPSMTVTKPTPIPAICLLGLAIPVWLAEAAVPVLLPVELPVLRLPLPV